MGKVEDTYNELLNRRIQQFLVHSFLYYQLNMSIIDDSFYDRICVDLVKLKTNENYKKHRYSSFIEGLDSSGTGFFIKEYPPRIISRALHLLYDENKRNGLTESFEQFVKGFGYSIIVEK